MTTKTTALVMDLVRWTERQNINLQLYLEWWLTHPEAREQAPYKIEFDPNTGKGQIRYKDVTVGEFHMIRESDYLLDWIRSVADSELLGKFGLEGLQSES